MDSVLTIRQQRARGAPSPGADDEVRKQVWELISGLYPSGRVNERRNEQRYPYPHLVYLSPLPTAEAPFFATPIVVVGKDLSPRGIGFYHQQTIPYRLMNLSLRNADGCWIGFLVDITWCRFNQYGWYDSGGRLLEVAAPAIAASELLAS